MTLAAFLDAGLSIAKLRRELKKLKVDEYSLAASKVTRQGIAGTRFKVKLKKSKIKSHRHYPDIVRIIGRSGLDDGVKERALAIFETIARAESRVHATPVEKVHFHEVGAVDSIVDIVGAAIAFEELAIDEVAASPLNLGSGSVQTEHGVLPVPAPATALILEGVPTYSEGAGRELTTPTGAAILKTLAGKFGPQPLMTVKKTGHGAGGAELAGRPNILRLFIGETEGAPGETRLMELQTNIDDMNPQIYPLVSEMLFKAGALDVFITPIQMKKGRPASLLTVLCPPGASGKLEQIIFKNTSTLGIRRLEVSRVCLERGYAQVKTRYGPVQVKIGLLPGGASKSAPEFESVAKAASRHNVPFDAVYREALKAASQGSAKRPHGNKRQ